MHQLHDQSIVFPDDKKDPANPNRWTEIKFNGSEFKAGNCFMTQMVPSITQRKTSKQHLPKGFDATQKRFLMKIIGFEKTTVRGSNDGAGEEGDAGFSTTSCKILATREPPEVFPFNEWRLDVRYLPAEPEDALLSPPPFVLDPPPPPSPPPPGYTDSHEVSLGFHLVPDAPPQPAAPPYPPQTPGERLRKVFTVSMEIATG